MSHKLYWVSPDSGRSWRSFALMKCWSLRGSFDDTPDWSTVGSRWGGLQDQRTNDITTDCEYNLLSKPIAYLKYNIWIKMTPYATSFHQKDTSKQLESQRFFFQYDDVSVCFKHYCFCRWQKDHIILILMYLCSFNYFYIDLVLQLFHSFSKPKIITHLINAPNISKLFMSYTIRDAVVLWRSPSAICASKFLSE